MAYHLGHLAVDRVYLDDHGHYVPVKPYFELAATAWQAYREGLVELTQQRMGSRFIYRATRTARGAKQPGK